MRAVKRAIEDMGDGTMGIEECPREGDPNGPERCHHCTDFRWFDWGDKLPRTSYPVNWRGEMTGHVWCAHADVCERCGQEIK